MVFPSEWMKFFDERAGRYRFKHKGSGVIRDTLLSLGKEFKKGATQAAKKTTKATAEKVGRKVGQVMAEKGDDKIRQMLRKRRPARPKARVQTSPPSDAMLKLSQVLANQL